MEFKFRAIDNRPSDDPMITIHDPILNPTNARDATQRQMEKDRIREEILAAERRRVLEIEVRRELQLEREFAMRRRRVAEEEEGELVGFGFDDRVDPTLPQQHLVNEGLTTQAKPNSNLSGEKPKTTPCLSEVPVSSSKKINWEEAHSFRLSSSCIASSPKPVAPMWLSEPVPVNKYLTLPARPSELNKDKLIILPKPNPNLSGMKRKTPPTKGPSYVPVSSSKKIHKEEWSCALCQVSVSNEKAFDGHLNGKRHKASERRLQAENLSKIFNSKNTAKKIDLEKLQSNGAATSELGEKNQRGLLELNGISDRDTSKEKPSEEKKEELPMQNDLCGEYFKNNVVEVKPMLVLQRKEEATKAKKFKFLCDFCKVGTNNPKVMEKHRKGKKHMDQLKELTEKYTDRVKELEKNKVRTTTDVIEEANVHTPASSMAPEATHEANVSISLPDSINVTEEANVGIPTTAVAETSLGANEAQASVSTTDVTEEANANNVPTKTSVAMASSSSQASDAAETVRKLEVYEKMIKARLGR